MNKAYQAFEDYISSYDMTIPSIKLKVIHTYEVVKVMKYLCKQLNLNEEDTYIASLIGLLHDIGRFNQWMKFQSFADYKTIDHALYSSQILFDEGLIRRFIDDDCFDHYIKIAIEQHNKYKIDEGFNERELLFIHLIRDADKLDNFRVKEEEKIEDILYASLDQVNASLLSNEVYHQMIHQQLVYAPYRKSYIDLWVSYIAFIYDLHFICSLDYIRDNDWINRSFNRLNPTNEITRKQYQELKEKAEEYIGVKDE